MDPFIHSIFEVSVHTFHSLKMNSCGFTGVLTKFDKKERDVGSACDEGMYKLTDSLFI